MPLKKINLPNVITITRIILIPFFLNFLIYGYTSYALITFVAAGMTDALDGAVARLTGTKSELGATLDPIADKMLAVAAFIALTAMGDIPLWLTLTVIFRDVIIVTGSMVLYLQGHDLKIRPVLTGKAATFLQLTLLSVALLGLYLGRVLAVMDYLVWLTLMFTVASGVQYVLRGFKIANQKAEVGG